MQTFIPNRFLHCMVITAICLPVQCVLPPCQSIAGVEAHEVSLVIAHACSFALCSEYVNVNAPRGALESSSLPFNNAHAALVPRS
jgi:hypothetical protein